MIRVLFTTIVLCVTTLTARSEPFKTIDLAEVDDSSPLIQRIYGSVGNGRFGVPVAGGFDMDGDGHRDYAFAAMLADPLSRVDAGQVFLVFGDGTIGDSIDTAQDNDRVLPIYGSGNYEHAGSEIWMADVTGDGLGDLIICRQDFSQTYNANVGSGEGAMTIIPGQPGLKTLAETGGAAIDLAAGNPGLSLTHIIGGSAGDRLCMWVRTGDLTGDGIDDIAVAADQEDSNAQINSGAVYVLRGGNDLFDEGEVDLEGFGTDAVFPGSIMRIRPPENPAADLTISGATVTSPVPNTVATNFHLGATLNIATLDNGTAADLLMTAGLNRAGGVLGPRSGLPGQGSGGSAQGTVYILWEDSFTGDWADPTPDIIVTAGPGDFTVIDGGVNHDAFGEELIGGLDYNGDDEPDVFFGDLTADGLTGIPFGRGDAGSGHIFYTAGNLRNKAFDYDSPPAGQAIASFLGPVVGAISGDTNMHGDFNNDGVADIASSSPHDNRFGRANAGSLHVMLGEAGENWPAVMDFSIAGFPDEEDIKVINIHGARGDALNDRGDTLAYSGAAGDIDNDGYTDIIMNEMVGNGTTVIDVGNLLLVSGKEMSRFGDLMPPLDDNRICFPIQSANGQTAVVCL